MILNNIKNIVFDLGGVLIELNKERCIDSFKAIGFEQAAKLIDFYHPAAIFNQLEIGSIGTDQVCEYIRNEAGRNDISNHDIIEAFRSFLVAIPIEKLRLVKSLRDSGFKIYALSNINEIVMPLVTEVLFTQDGLTMDDYFDKAYLSYIMKALKPSEEIFQMMIDDSGMVPSQTLFIDDSEKNVNTAHQMGFNVYHASANEDFSHLFTDGEL